jgi:TonB family protein
MKLRTSLQSAWLLLSLILLPFYCSNAWAQQSKPVNPSEYEKAVELYQKGDNAGAIEILQKVVRAERDNADAWNLLGLAYYKEGLLWRAGDAFEHLLRFRPDSAEAHAKLSYALILGGQSEKAVANAERAIELGEQSAEPHYAIAEANLRAGNYLRAVEQADEALKINSGFKLALITRSMALYYLHRYAESATCLEDFLSLDRNDPDADVWREQLRKIRVIERRQKSPEVAPDVSQQIFNGRDVTTKVRVLEKPEPTYTESARQAGVTGTVVLRAVFSDAGEVTNIFVSRALSHGLNGKAIAAATAIRFVPATKDGKPVSMWMELQYNFNLY